MLGRHTVVRGFCQAQKRAFSLSRRALIDVNSHHSVSDTINHLQTQGESDPDLKNGHSYLDIINHHASRLEKQSPESAEEADKEYNDLYTLSLQLSKLLESTPDVSEELKKNILNSLIEKFTKYNYAVSTLAFKKLLNDKQNLSQGSVSELICHNPGRVNSSWDVYESLKPEEPHDKILVAILKKLLYGDKVEIKEGLADVDVEKVIKIFQVYERIGNKDLIDEQSLLKLVTDLMKLDCSALITQMVIPSSIFEKIINDPENFDLKNVDYLHFYEASISNGVSLSGNALLKSLMPISKLQTSTVLESENLKKVKEKLGVSILQLAPLPDVVDEIREQIQELGLDDEAPVMIDLMKSAGFYSNDLPTAIKYFQHYQSKVPDGTVQQNDLKTTMSLVFVYSCVSSNDPKNVNVAEALVPQSPLPAANNLASLVLFHGWFGDSDKAFDIYNQSLDLYLKPLEEFVSERGMLVQALATVSLLGKEIGLAKLIKDKSLENKLIDETCEIKLSNLFKEYGDKLEECKDSDGAFRESMKKIFLRTIIDFSP